MNKTHTPAVAAVALLAATLAGSLPVGFPSWIGGFPGNSPVAQGHPDAATNATHRAQQNRRLPASALLNGVVSLDAKLTTSALPLGQGRRNVYLVCLLEACLARGASSGRRPPLNICLLIDKSGSMEKNGKMDRAREAARLIVDRLTGRDTVSIVTYSTDADALLRPVHPADKPAIHRIIDDIGSGGGTNMSEGLELAFEQVKAAFDPNSVNRILLLSDGKANLGERNPRALVELAADMAKADVTLTTLGLGVDFNEDLLVDMAEAGRGNFYFIEDAAQTVEKFREELDGLMNAVAKNIEIAITPAEGVELARVYGYDTIRRGPTTVIPVGSLSSGRKRKIVVALSVPADEMGEHKVAELRFGYDSLARTAASVVHRAELGLTVTDDDRLVRSSRSIEAMARAEAAVAAEELDRALKKARANRTSEAVDLLQRQIIRTKERNASMKSQLLQVQVRHMEAILEGLEDSALDSEKKAIVMKRGKARSYLMMR